jgi:hypothetical protein
VRNDARWLNFRAVVISGTLVWGVALLACFELKRLFPAPPVVAVACGVVVCGLATLVYLRTPALARSDRELLAQLFHGREARLLHRLGVLRQFGHA